MKYSNILKSKIKHFLKILSFQYIHIRKTLNINKKWYGNLYGGFYVHPNLLSDNSIIYSIGIGEDISFDRALIVNHNCNVYGFDPTPKSIDWIKGQLNTPSNFNFFDFGIADKSGMIDFYLPKNINHVSGSFVKQENVNEKQKITVEMKSWDDIIKKFSHNQIDILKMDIEGAEYSVLDSILKSDVKINQILIEFHDRLFDDGKNKTKEAIIKLKHHGYEIFGIADSFEEISFIKKSILNQNKIKVDANLNPDLA